MFSITSPPNSEINYYLTLCSFLLFIEHLRDAIAEIRAEHVLKLSIDLSVYQSDKEEEKEKYESTDRRNRKQDKADMIRGQTGMDTAGRLLVV
uniref:Uncharacterized protein n=1 Tax=Pristionchus pacificus TaxID=54126 RepID=A0A2A6CFW1_PRIPA|eukprot:PDM77104.1 hypothetical protein PRIPAC_43016 [Pristionchus pacificus]